MENGLVADLKPHTKASCRPVGQSAPTVHECIHGALAPGGLVAAIYRGSIDANCNAGVFGWHGYLALELVSAVLVCVSVTLTVAETVPNVEDLEANIEQLWKLTCWLEMIFTCLFVCEYCIRVSFAKRRCQYVLSFFGVVDVMTSFPSFFLLLVVQDRGSFVVTATLRVLRLLRVFRVLKLLKYVQEAQMILLALAKESRPLLVFLFFVCVMLLVCSSVIYVVEGDSQGFASIPECLWWSAVTITTVGYGDVVPQSVLGRFLASMLMLSGYGLLAVPTIVGYGMRADAPSDDNGDQQGGADTQGIQMNTWSDRGVRKEECQHFPFGHPFPESLSCSKMQSEADQRDAYVYFIHLPTRSTDMDISGQVGMAACHTLAETAIYAFLSVEAAWDYHSASGIRDGPKPVLTESSCCQLSKHGCINGFFPSVEVGIVVESIDRFSCTYRIGLFPGCSESTSKPPCATIRIVQDWVERFDRSAMTAGDNASRATRACIPDVVRTACSEILANCISNEEFPGTVHIQMGQATRGRAVQVKNGDTLISSRKV